MRYALAVLALLAGAAVWLLLHESNDARDVRRDQVAQEEARGARGRPETPDDAAAGEVGPRADAPDARRPSPKCRLVYGDGTPAANIALQLAVGRPFRTKIYRNGDYPEKVIWLVTHHAVARTGPDGAFAPPRGDRIVAYTEADAPAYVLAEIDPFQGDVPAVRRVRVTGVLRAADGGRYDRAWVAAQNSRPEDWQTRYSKEKDSFVHGALGDLGVDPGARVEVLADEQARFELRVLPGKNWFVFGENGRLGTRELVVPARDLDLGDVIVAPQPPAETGNHTVHGIVRDCAGRPRPETAVWIWDGNVGEPSHVVEADAEGRFRCAGLGSPHVIAWGVAGIAAQHAVLPEQSSGTIPLPCHTPLSLIVPAPEEYQWLAAHATGFHLIVRDGVFVGGSSLERGSRVGLPPGSYHLVTLTPDGRILEADHVVTEGGNASLGDMRDTTRR